MVEGAMKGTNLLCATHLTADTGPDVIKCDRSLEASISPCHVEHLAQFIILLSILGMENM